MREGGGWSGSVNDEEDEGESDNSYSGSESESSGDMITHPEIGTLNPFQRIGKELRGVLLFFEKIALRN